MSALLDSLAGSDRRRECNRNARHVVASVDTRIAGIPCRVDVTHYLCVRPWAGSVHTCPSADDYYGYTEVEFDVADRRGRPAQWLEKKLTNDDRERITREVRHHMEQQ
jgi:hypothetical protein